MFSRLLICGIISLTFVQVSNSKHSFDFVPCQADDDGCMLKVINKLAKEKYKGDIDFGLPNLHPVEGSMIWIPTPSNPVNITVEFSFFRQSLFKNARATEIHGFGVSPEAHKHIILEFPQAVLVGNYTASGSIFNIPVNGRGPCKIAVGKLVNVLNFDSKTEKRDGENYLDISDIELEFNAKSVFMNFENIVEGDKTRSEFVNKLLNANMQTALISWYTSIKDVYSLFYKTVIGNVFSAHPYRQLVAGGL